MSRIAVTACPFSGTLYTAKLFRAIGLDIGHEVLWTDGLVSWPHAHNTKEDFIRDGFAKDMTLLHQARHPLMVISQLRDLGKSHTYSRTNENTWDMVARRSSYMLAPWQSESLIERSMMWWYWWNKVGIEKADFAYAIEDIDRNWKAMLDMIGVDPVGLPAISKTTHRKQRKNILSWDDVYAENADLTLKILDLMARFGYEQIPAYYMSDAHYNFPEAITLTERK